MVTIPLRHSTSLQVHVHTLEKIDDLAAAIDVLVEFIERRTQHAVVLKLSLDLARLHVRNEDLPSARRVLGNVPVAQLVVDSSALLLAAQLAVLCDDPRALEFAWEARRSGLDDASIQVQYAMFMLLEAGKLMPNAPTSVGVDTTVTLASETSVRTLTILRSSDVRLADELPDKDDLARAILGKAQGDSVQLPGQYSKVSTYEIRGIQSKHHHAMECALRDFDFKFPNQPGLVRIALKEGSIEDTFRPFLEGQADRERHLSHCLRQYDQGQLPLAAVASLLQSTVYDTWAELTRIDRCSIRSGFERIDDLRCASMQLKRGVVLDYTALLTLQRLRLLEVLAANVEEVVVPRAILHDLRKVLAGPQGRRRLGTMTSVGGTFQMLEFNATDEAQRRTDLEQLAAFVRDRATFHPVETALDLDRAQFTRLESVLGPGGIACVLLAKQLSLPYCADDQVLRKVAQSEWGAETLPSQSVLLWLKDSEAITRAQYSDAVMRLVQAGYVLTPVSVEDIICLISSSAGKLPSQLTGSLRALSSSNSDLSSAANVAARVVGWARREPLPFAQLSLLVDALTSALMDGRNRVTVVAAFQVALGRVLSDSDPVKSLLIDSLRVWEDPEIVRAWGHR